MTQRSWLVLIFGFMLGAMLCTAAEATTYYVRPDGGSSGECTGTADAPYPGSGSGQNCAFDHPFYAIAPQGNNPTKMNGGDTLIIDGSNGGQYMMGWGAPNIQDTSVCYANWPWGCYMRSVPSGPSPAQPTRILGKGWNTGCSNPPQLWGTERNNRVLNLSGSSNVEVQCLEITDHSECQEHGPNPCNRDSIPYGPWAQTGLVANDSENVLLKNVNIHGMAYRGIYAGRLKDWTLENSRIVANSFVGWDGDIGAGVSGNTGTITFNRVSVLYNGCGERYPASGGPYNCYSQDQGGYGDGLGTHLTGASWVITDSDFSYNVSDGLDLLYHNGQGQIIINRSRFEGNAGNQVKTGTSAVISNSLIIGNCAWFKNNPITWKSSTFNNCRAGGNALAMGVRSGYQNSIYNSTITSNGDVIIQSAGDGCTGGEKIVSRNNIYYGGTEFNDGSDKAGLYWSAGKTGNGDGSCGSVPIDDANSVIYGTKYYPTICQGKPGTVCADPQLGDSFEPYFTGKNFNAALKSGSPARGRAAVLTGKSSLDFNSFDRGGQWDAGALEFGSSPGAAPAPEPTCADGPGYCSSQSDCTGNGFHWYDGACHSEPEPEPICADGLQYCLTQGDCEGQGHYWYDGICHLDPEPVPTCSDGPEYCEDETGCETQGHFWYNGGCHQLPAACSDGTEFCFTQGECEGEGHHWYNGACHDQSATCADGIAYCTTASACGAQGYHWYNNTCNAQPEPEPDPTCADGIEYCTDQASCAGQGYHWYSNMCNAQPEAQPEPEPEPEPTCADGIQFCTTQVSCEGQNHFWYNNACNAQALPEPEPEPEPTCADGIQYCTDQASCAGQGYHWYNNTCNAQPEPEPEPTCADDPAYCGSQSVCEGQGYFWLNSACQVTPPTCSDGRQYCTKKSDCENAGHTWSQGACIAKVQPTCNDDIAYCSNQPQCESAGYFWYDGGCHPLPKPVTNTGSSNNSGNSANSNNSGNAGTSGNSGNSGNAVNAGGNNNQVLQEEPSVPQVPLTSDTGNTPSTTSDTVLSGDNTTGGPGNGNAGGSSSNAGGNAGSSSNAGNAGNAGNANAGNAGGSPSVTRGVGARSSGGSGGGSSTGSGSATSSSFGDSSTTTRSASTAPVSTATAASSSSGSAQPSAANRVVVVPSGAAAGGNAASSKPLDPQIVLLSNDEAFPARPESDKSGSRYTSNQGRNAPGVIGESAVAAGDAGTKVEKTAGEEGGIGGAIKDMAENVQRAWRRLLQALGF